MLLIDQTEPGWYCFTALPKREHIAATLLGKEAGLRCFCPRIAYDKKTQRGKVRFVECLFPGYLFVHADLREQFRRILATSGIRNVVNFGGRIPRIPDAFIDDLHTRFNLQEMQEIHAPILQAGSKVVLTEGPFKDVEAIISGEVDALNRVKLLLEFLGRQIELRVPVDKVFLETERPKEKVWKD